MASYSLVVLHLSSLTLGDKAILPDSVISPKIILSVLHFTLSQTWALLLQGALRIFFVHSHFQLNSK